MTFPAFRAFEFRSSGRDKQESSRATELFYFTVALVHVTSFDWAFVASILIKLRLFPPLISFTKRMSLGIFFSFWNFLSISFGMNVQPFMIQIVLTLFEGIHFNYEFFSLILFVGISIAIKPTMACVDESHLNENLK